MSIIQGTGDPANPFPKDSAPEAYDLERSQTFAVSPNVQSKAPDVESRAPNVESKSPVACGICLGEDKLELIKPCLCRWVHRSCLDEWRSIRNGLNFSKCEVCRSDYITDSLRPTMSDDSDPVLVRRFRLYMARDISLFLIGVFCVMWLCSLLFYICSPNALVQWTIEKTNGQWSSPASIYFIWGQAFFWSTIGILGGFYLCISNCGKDDPHFHTGGSPLFCYCPGSCGICGSGGGGGSGGGDGAAIVCAIICIILVLFGIFIGIWGFTVLIDRWALSRRKQIWNFELAQKHVVRDLSAINP
jgi:hypothetical protein